MKQQIIIIGSEVENCKQLKYALRDRQIQAYYALSIEEGIKHFNHYSYSLVVVDIPFCAETIRALRLIQRIRPVLILVLAAFEDIRDVVDVLSIADSFLPKPYNIDICAAHIKALLRRTLIPEYGVKPSVLSNDHTLMIDCATRTVYVLENPLVLPRKQFELIYFLTINEGQVLTREQIYHHVWKDDIICGDHPLSGQIKELRSKLKSIPGAPDYIQTYRGVGYCFGKKH